VSNTAPSSLVVPAGSIVVLADHRLSLPDWKEDPSRRVKIEKFKPLDD
jgi:hypothetical protein